MYEILKDWIKKEMREVLKAPFAFTLTFIIAITATYFVLSWHYEGLLRTRDERLQLMSERLDACRTEVKISDVAIKGVPKIVTISAGEITLLEAGSYSVDTEDAAESDELTKINGLPEGDVVRLSAANGARTVVLKKGHYLRIQANFGLDSEYDVMVLESMGGDICRELFRASND